MKKSVLFLFLLLSTGIAFSQTTITLQDQCNCEVLSGTDVSSPGALVPSGADTGDIYVNTNTGTIYFWDGNSWELTATDDQQLTGFTFNDATNTLTLTLEDGGSVNVDLSSLSDSLIDTNTTIASFGIDGANTNLVITDSDTNTYAVALADIAALIDTDDQTLSEVLSEGNSAGTSITNVTDPTNAQDAATKNYVDTQITANEADGSETIVNGGTDISVSGSGTTGDPYIVNSTFTEVDGSITNEIQDLASVLGEGNSAGTSITNVTDPTNAQDAATKNYVDTQITANAADGSETIVNGGTDISVSGSGTTGDPYVVNNTFTEVDGSITNEVNTRFEVSGANLEIEDGNGTLQVPLANLGSDDQTLSEVLSEGNSAGTSITNVTDPTNAQDAATKNYVDSQITANAADGSETIVNGGTDISVSGSGTTGDPYVVNNTFTEVDGSVTNEINTRFEVSGANLEIEDGNGTLQVPLANLGSDDQTLSEVLSEGNSAGTSITNVTDPTNAQDAATKNYVDTQITANAADGSETIVNGGTDISVSGSGTTGDPYIVNNTFTEVDGSITNEIQDLASVLGEGNSAGTSITNVTDPTNAQDAATKNYVDTQITANAADGSETIVNGGTDISVSGSGTTGDPYVVNNTFTEVDGSITNEIQDLASVLGEGNSAGTSITNVTDPTNAQDAATKNYVDSQITANAADGSETIVNAGTDISVSGSGTTGDPYVVNNTFTEVDGSVTNEINTRFEVSGANLEIEDGNGTLQVPLANLGSDDQTLSEVLSEGNSAGTSITNVTDPTNAQDAATKNYVDSQITANAADGSETIVNGGTDISVSGSGTTGDPYIVNSTFTEVDGSITNEMQDLASVLGEGNSAGTSITNVTDPTNAQDAATKNYVDTQITANAADGSETIVNGGTDISVSGSGTTGDPYIVNSTFTEVDGSITNEIQDLASVLGEGNSAGTSITNVTDPTNAQDAATKNYVDSQITANAADGSETVVNGGTDISVSGSGTTGDPYIVNSTFTESQEAIDVPYDPSTTTLTSGNVQNVIEELKAEVDAFAATSGQTNTASNVGAGGVGTFARKTGADLEFKNINAGSNKVTVTNDVANDEIDIDINEANITITESQISDLSHTVDTDDQTLSEVLSEGNSAGTSITNVTDPTNAQDAATKSYVDTQITANAADGSETVVNGGTDISVSGSGTTGDPYIVNSTFTEVDGSITNEIQDLASVLGEGNSAGTSITNVTDPTNAQDAATKNYVDTQITANAADGSETIVNGGTDISVSGSGTTGDPYIVNSTFTEVDGSITNEIQDLASVLGEGNSAGTSITNVTDPTNAQDAATKNYVDTQITANAADGSETIVNGGTDISVSGSGTTGDPYIVNSTFTEVDGSITNEIQDLASVLGEGNSAGTSITNVTDPTNAQDAATKNYVDTQITANAADGSETVVNAGTDISVSGSGTSGDPYVVNSTFTEVDGSVTNEINTRFEVSGANLEIEDSNGTLQVPLANLGSDDQTLSEVLSEGNSAGTSITNVTDPTNAQDAATKNYVDSQITANAADGSETVVNGGTDISVSGSGTSGDPYVVNSTFTEVDGSVTNEINTRFEVSGANLEIEDGNGTLQVPLANLGSDDQTLSEVLSEGNSAGTSITNVTDPTNAQDAATKNYVDTQITANAADGSETIVNGGTDISVSGSGTSGDPYVVNSTFTEVDGSITNEIQDLASVLGEGNSAGTSITNVTDPTNAQDAATKNYVDTQITANAADGSETIVNGGTDISVSGSGTSGDPYVVNSTFTEVDGSVTNEINTRFEVSGANLEIEDGNGTLQVPLANLGSDDQTLSEVLSEGNSAGTSITNVTDPTNAQDAATKNYVDTQITANAADGSETVVNAGTDISVSGSGTSGDPYVVNSTFTEVDGSVTNEINTRFEVSGANLEIEDGNGTLQVPLANLGSDDQTLSEVLSEGNSAGTSITNVTDPTNAQDAATKNYVDTQITANAADGSETIVNGGTDISVSGSGTTGDPYIVNSTFTEVDGSITNEIQDLASVLGEGNSAGTSITNVTDPTNAQDAATKNYVDTQITANAADGSETIVNGGTDISVSGSGTSGDPYVVNSTFTEVDGSVTNEINTRFEVSGANLEIEDGNGTLQVPLANLGSDDQTLSEVLSEGNSAGTSITNVTDPTNAQDAATKNYVDSQITANAADGSETIVNGGTDISVSGSGTTGDPYVVNNTFTEVDGSVTNEINTRFEVSGANLEIEDGNGTLQVPLANLGSDDQTLSEVLSEGNSAGTSITNVTDPTNAQDAATKNYVDTQITANAADGSETIVNGGTDISVSGSGTTGDPYIVNNTFTEVDGSITNEIQDLASVLGEGNSAGTSITNVTDPTNAQDAATKNYVDTQITANAADGSETIVNGGTDISVSGSGTTGDPYVVNNTFTEVDGSITNEIQDLASVLGEGNSAGTSITNVTDPTNAQDAATKNYVDSQITANAADGSETIVNAGTDISVSGSGTTGDPYVVNNTFTEVDGSVTNEINTRFEVSGANLEIEDGNGTLQVPLANLGSDDQTLSEVLSEGNSAGTSITNVTDPTNAQDAATKNYVDSQITANAADGSETIVNGGTDISVSGSGTTGDPYIVNSTFTEVDGSITNEIQDLASVLGEGNSAGTSITNVTDPTNAQDAATKNYVDSQITANAADGSETIVNGGTDISVSGSGTSGDPYVVNSTFTEVDGSVTNEINTRFEVSGANLEIEDGNGTLQVPLANLGSDDQTLSEVLSEGNSAGTSITNVTDPTNAQDAATKNYVDSQITANAADGSETIVNGGTDISVSGSGTTGDPYVVNNTFTEVDGSVTNEINTRFEVSGANLEIEDSNGTLQVPLADINIDQTASDVDLDTSVDSDGDGSSETTVEGAIQAMSPIVSKAARIFYPPSIAVDASTNGIGRTINLYDQYVAQFGTPAVASLGAPAAIPTYAATDLYYYVTYADPAVFDNMSIDASGELTYDIIGQPSDYNALINVVFVVK